MHMSIYCEDDRFRCQNLATKDMILKFIYVCLWLLVGSSGRIHQGVEIDIVDIFIGILER